MKLNDLIAIGFDDYNVEITMKDDYTVLEVRALEDINEKYLKIKTGEVIPESKKLDFYYEDLTEWYQDYYKEDDE